MISNYLEISKCDIKAALLIMEDLNVETYGSLTI